MFAYITALLILYAFKNGDGNDTSVEYIFYTVSAHLTVFCFFVCFCFHTVWGEKKKKEAALFPVRATAICEGLKI